VLVAHRYIADYRKPARHLSGQPDLLALSLDGVSNVRYGDAQLRQVDRVFIQTRIAYWPAPKTSDRPTP